MVHGVKAFSGTLLSTSWSTALSADVMSPLESLLGHKGRRFATQANKGYNQGNKRILDDEQGEKFPNE
jgi:hypothetical protein